MELLERGFVRLARDILIAARPFSLSLALYGTSVPLALAFRTGVLPGHNPATGLLRVILVTLAGLAVLTATNLINDFFECGIKNAPESRKLYRFMGKSRGSFEILVFFIALACFGFTALAGLYLALSTTTALFWIGALGLGGGYGYTGEPVVYKRFGLGAILSFLLLGPLMNYGAWLAVGGAQSIHPILVSLPVSLLIPAMMLANEIRDVERDKDLGIKTATVILGRKTGQALYDALLILSFSLASALVIIGLAPGTTLACIVALPLAFRARSRVAGRHRDAIPATNLLHLVFGALYIMGLLVGAL
ncbi:1,4-dihydroxy-2-naphthoate octaprenyltransferase [Spirochaetota bacterium]|jgi:1,4-dihydroxy-2-naphthoate octaprenyltransferase